MELEVEGRRPVGKPKKTWNKAVEEDMRKLNIMEDMAEDRQQWGRFISRLTPGVGKLRRLTKMMMMMIMMMCLQHRLSLFKQMQIKINVLCGAIPIACPNSNNTCFCHKLDFFFI